MNATVIPRTHTVRVTVSQAVLRLAQQNLYDLAKAEGFTGTFAEFLESLKPPMTWASTNW